MSVLPLTLHPSDILRKRTTEVPDPMHADVQTLVRDMRVTMVAARGIGLAANQVGHDLRMFVIDKNLAADAGISDVFINPKQVKGGRRVHTSDGWLIVKSSIKSMEEGCLSVPGKFGDVRRPSEVTVHAVDDRGKEFRVSAKGLLARVLQHEIDHLNGMLFIDKAEGMHSVTE